MCLHVKYHSTQLGRLVTYVPLPFDVGIAGDDDVGGRNLVGNHRVPVVVLERYARQKILWLRPLLPNGTASWYAGGVVRLLYCTELLWPYIGGIQVMASQTLPALRRRGYQIEVITSQPGGQGADEEERAGIRVHRLPIREALASNDTDALARMSARVAALGERFQPDVVHMNFAGPSMWLYLTTLRRNPAPLVVAFRGVPEQPGGPGSLFEHATVAAAWTVGVSKAVLDSVLASHPELSARSSVIYNAFREPSLRPGPLPFGKARLLCLGRLVEEKCFELAVAAMPAVLARFPETELVIAGDGPERSRLEGHAGLLGIESATRFLGWISPGEVPALLNETTLLLMPSRIEGLPGVAIQAAQMARPVIATRVGGSPEVVTDGVTGLLVERGDCDGLGRAICSLLDDPTTTSAMGSRARQLARQRFNWEDHVSAYDELYRKVV